MELTIGKWGNSQGVRLPKELLKHLHASVGSVIKVKLVKEGVILEAEKPSKEYSIYDLVKEIDLEYTSAEVDWGKPEGREVW
jgi:antitoxin component of MazEF toxin-antitoxin module